eukprot:11171087-Lingulodinium_polyedra.AAC.1
MTRRPTTEASRAWMPRKTSAAAVRRGRVLPQGSREARRARSAGAAAATHKCSRAARRQRGARR